MEQIVLKGEKRTGNGTADARRMRLNGFVTGNLYGHGESNVSFMVSHAELHKLVYGGHHLLNLEIEGVQEVGIMKELQFDTYGDRITHVDFLRVSLDEVIEASVEVRPIGMAKGVASGGTLDIVHHSLAIRGKARDLPEHIDLEVDHLEIGDAIRAREVVLPAGVEVLLGDEEAIIICHGAQVEEEPPAAEEGQEPASSEEPPAES